MGFQNKIANRLQVLRGKAKRTAGKISRNPRLEVEGKLNQGEGNLRQAGEKLKDAGRGVFGSQKRRMRSRGRQI